MSQSVKTRWRNVKRQCVSSRWRQPLVLDRAVDVCIHGEFRRITGRSVDKKKTARNDPLQTNSESECCNAVASSVALHMRDSPNGSYGIRAHSFGFDVCLADHTTPILIFLAHECREFGAALIHRIE